MSRNKSLVAVLLLLILHALCERYFFKIFVIKERFVFTEAGLLAKIKCDFLKTLYHKVRRKDFSLSFFFPPPQNPRQNEKSSFRVLSGFVERKYFDNTGVFF